MSDKFDGISDQELIDEFEQRQLEDELDIVEELRGSIDDLDHDLAVALEEQFNLDGVESDLKSAMEDYRANNYEDFSKKMADIFYELYGVIC